MSTRPNYHAQLVRVLAAHESGKSNALLDGNVSTMSEDYFRIIYTSGYVRVVHTSGSSMAGYTRSQLSGEGNDGIKNSDTFFTRTAGNEGAGQNGDLRYKIDYDPNNLPQSQRSGMQLLHGVSAVFGAANENDGVTRLSAYSSVNMPTAVLLEPNVKINLREADIPDWPLGPRQDEYGYNVEPLPGTSFTAPIAAGWIAKSPEIGGLLTLYAIVSSAQPVLTREKQDADLKYMRNAAGHCFNIGSGAGLLTEERFLDATNRIYTSLQNGYTSIPFVDTYPFQQALFVTHPKGIRYNSENVFVANVPDDFSAVTIQIRGEFSGDDYGPLILVGPSGTEFPLAYTQSRPSGYYGFSSNSEAWAGERTKGQWYIYSPEGVPLDNLQITIKGDKGTIIEHLIATAPSLNLDNRYTHDLKIDQFLLKRFQ